MSLNMDEFVQMIKQASDEMAETKKPFSLLFGTVTSEEPNLKIFVNQKLTLDEQQLILTNNVRDYTIYMTAGKPAVGDGGEAVVVDEHYTENEKYIKNPLGSVPAGGGSIDEHQFAEHKHKYVGKKKWTVHLALKVGEKVILLRCDGGQKYIVLDRVEAPDE